MMRGAEPVARRWHMLDDGVLPYALAGLRALWIAPLLQWAAWTVSPETRALLELPLVFVLLAGGTAAAQIYSFRFEGRRAALGLALVSLGAVGVTVGVAVGAAIGEAGPWIEALTASLPRLLATLALGGGLWWWGLLAGRERAGYDGLARNFVAGLAVLMGLAAINRFTTFLPASTLLAYVLAYVGLGLFLLALAGIQEARRYESARADHDLPLARHWWSTVGAVVALLLLAALLISRLLAPAGLEGLAAAAGALLHLVGEIVSWLILLVSYPIFRLLEWLAPFLQIDRLAVPPPPSLDGSFASQAGADLQGQASISPAVQTALGVLGAAGLAALIVLAFVLALRRFGEFAEDDVAEAHESILSLDLLKAQLAGLRRRRGANGAPPAPFAPLSGDDPRVQVRRTYQALLAWAAGRGIERSPAMTPDRFGRLLRETYPQHGEQFGVITAAYDLARYGAGSISGETATAAAAAWQQILTTTDTATA